MSRLPAFALLFILASCGGTSSDPMAGSCTITVSGAVSGTATEPCIPSGFVSSGVAGFGLSATAASVGTIGFTAQFTGQTFATGTYESSSLTESSASDTYPEKSETDWDEESGTAAAGNPEGSATLVITSTGNQINGASGTDWVGTHGTLDAVLPPSPDNSSTQSVTLHVSFQGRPNALALL